MGDGDELKGNYLCIGAGTSTLSFVDTMLSSTDKSITFSIVRLGWGVGALLATEANVLT